MNTIQKALMTTSAGLLLSFGAVQAHAFTLDLGGYTGPLDIKFDLYTAECMTDATNSNGCYGNNTTGGASIGPSGGTLNETTYGVAHITSIQDDSSNTLWGAPLLNHPGEQILAVIYGIADKSITQAGSTFTINNVGCVGGTSCDGLIHLDFYGIDSLAYHGFGTSETPTNDQLQANDRIGFSGFEGVTDLASSTLLAKTTFTTGARGTVSGVDLQQFTTSATLPASGKGVFLSDCVAGPLCTGAQAVNLNQNGQYNGADFSGQFTLGGTSGGPAAAGWLGFANDPLLTSTDVTLIPEPGVLSLLAGGLLGLTFTRRSVYRRS